MKKEEKLFKKMFSCDSIRIVYYWDMYFLIIGYTKNTKDNKVKWYINGKQMEDYDYIQEQVIASGKSKKELIKSAKYYKSLCGMTWEDYFKNYIKI